MIKRTNLLLCFLCLTQCSPESEDLVGTWRSDKADLSLQLNDNATFQVSFTLGKGPNGAIFQRLKDLDSAADAASDELRLKVNLLNLAFPRESTKGQAWYNSTSQISGKWRILGGQLYLSPFEGEVKDRSGEVIAKSRNRMPRSLLVNIALEQDLLTITLADGRWKGSEMELIRQ